jgi:predicted dehydrogenase
MNSLNRRGFVKQSLGLTLAAGAASLRGQTPSAPSNRVVVGLMGCGGRGSSLAGHFAAHPDVTIKTVCDVSRSAQGRAVELVRARTGKAPGAVSDFRRMLEDPEIDAIVNATPDHWHGVGTILACQAGKHVYVEKPASHNIWEGRKMIEAARKYRRVVQTGMQTRSSPYAREAREAIQRGELGQVHTVRVHQIVPSALSLARLPVAPVPADLDYDFYCGPAEMSPYRGNAAYLLQWNFSGGDLFADAVHQMDLARWLIGKAHPHTVHTSGGVLVYKGKREIPDTQTTTFEYDDDVMLVFQGSAAGTGWSKISPEVRQGDLFPEWLLCSTRVECHGTEGFMVFGRHGGGWQIFGRNGKPRLQRFGRPGDELHIADFIACIRSGQRPHADIEDGHLSAAMGHLANISYRVGKRPLRFDSATETFPGDPAANALLRRTYRAPWVVPEQV